MPPFPDIVSDDMASQQLAGTAVPELSGALKRPQASLAAEPFFDARNVPFQQRFFSLPSAITLPCQKPFTLIYSLLLPYNYSAFHEPQVYNAMALPRLTRGDYTVALICPMAHELAPLGEMLDQNHQPLQTIRDQNSYKLGSMAGHNVVIATMPGTGTHKAATVATQLLNDFPSIRFGLLVGIGGGIPSANVDIRLGDVVVSTPTGGFGGVVQLDRGKNLSDGKFMRTGSLAKPPPVLSAHVAQLSGTHEARGNQIKTFLSKLNPYMKTGGYTYQGSQQDLLFWANYTHPDEGTCEKCDPTKLKERHPRDDGDIPKIHYGTIGSSNSVIKDGEFRDKLRKELGIICVEMEAAGLMDDFPCLVIRGICDYADTHKNDRWQRYAAATAAAYAKELLSTIPSADMVTAPVAIQGGM